MRCAGATARSSSAFPICARCESLTLQGRRGAGRALREGAARGADALARQRVQRRGRDAISSTASAASSSSRRTSRSRSPPSRRSTGCRCRCATRTASWSSARRAATAPKARTSPRTSSTLKDVPQHAQGQEHSGGLRGARRGLHDQGGLPRAQRAAGGGGRAALRQSAQFGRRLAAPEGSGDHRVAAAAASSPMRGAR